MKNPAIDLNKELLRIINSSVIIDPSTCWLDGEHCPYGIPSGKFTERPRQFCVFGVCWKIEDFMPEIDHTLGDCVDKLVTKVLTKTFNEEAVTLASELRTIADDKLEAYGDQIKNVLLLAARVLEKLEEKDQSFNPEVVRREDVL